MGLDEFPLIHFLGIMLKAYEIDYILHRNSEIKLFERDNRGNPATFFEYYANNNFDNHKKWVLMKHQQKVFFNKFQKPCRSYKKICIAQNDFTKTVCSPSQPESEYHTFTQVLKKLRSNNARQAETQRSIRQRKMKRMCELKKLTQKEIDNDTEIGEETVLEYSTAKKHFADSPKASAFEEIESEETTAVGGPSCLENLLNNMVMNPRKKMEIDSSCEFNKKSENISTEGDLDEEENNAKKINYFSKPSTKIGETKCSRKQFRYDLQATPRRVNIFQNYRVIQETFFLDFNRLIRIKKELITSHLLHNFIQEKMIEKEVTDVLKG